MTLFLHPAGPFEAAAERYRDAGMAPVSLPAKAKEPPVEGFTGKKHRGVHAFTDADLRFLAEYNPGGNVGVRLPEDVVGIDVDVRNGGDQTVAFKAVALGPLPPTLSSTSREDGSRIAFYRVPAGLEWRDVGDGVETIWWGSRYAVAWPSRHPDTGATYRWYGADDAALPGPPAGGWDAVTAALPEPWVEALRKAERAEVAAVDLPTLRPAEVRRRVNGALRWLGEAKHGQRNARIFDTGVLVGGLWAQLPPDCADEDLDPDALRGLVCKVFADIGVDPDERKANDTLDRGWDTGVRDPAANPPPDFSVEPGEPEARPKVRLDVTNPDAAYKAACRALGTGSLSGVFRRDGSLVYTPRQGEDGYVEPTGSRQYEDGSVVYDEDGAAQVRRLDGPALRALVAHNADVFKMVTPQGQRVAQEKAAVLPTDTAALLLGSPEYVTGARALRAVVHTPLVLADGSVLAEPGYDAATGVLLLPEIDVPVPRGEVTRAQAAEAVALLDALLGPPGGGPTAGFPFVTHDDRATYLAALLTPLLREVAGPPYPLFAIGAPTPGSGKSYLAWILRAVHGGVFRAEMPRSDDELRKQITTILDQTTGPVVTFDNLSGPFASSRFDGLLTSGEWTDRLLGGNEEATLTNDRVWTVTGNNLTFGGDMRRRVRWVTIDAGVARPEERRFAIDLKPWVEERRGDLLGALLTLVVGWHQAGRPSSDPGRSDDYARWTRATQGILAWAGVPGKVGGAAREGGLEEAEDADVLDLLRAEFGARPWTAAEAVARGDFDRDLAGALPRPAHGGRPNAKSLGHWLRRWQDRPTESGHTLRKQGTAWRFERALAPEDLDLL
ncbi:bifunctional DNA primase/polymerase [Nocardioides ochotonae]|uniref:bifunctional DNA primase/polymerase n=1 Tax=Nocardioides ochotonae TaxID=2685869 RepID=UPI00140B6FE0|nr:bifunctional DNA primase/polymerase [Nocardioides ochotonae]